MKYFNIDFIAIGGFAKFLHETENEFKDVDFFIPENLNKSENIVQFLKSLLPTYSIEAYDFKHILRIKIKTLQIDLLPKLNGLNSEIVLKNIIIKKYGEETINVLGLDDLITNIKTVENLIK